jgi:hypothetical protein
MEQCNNLYMGRNIVNLANLPPQPFPTSHPTAISQPPQQESRKKRRSTTTGPKPNPPLPTPTNASVTSTENIASSAGSTTNIVKPSLDLTHLNHLTAFTPPPNIPFSPSFNVNALEPNVSLGTHDPASGFDPMFSIPTPYDQQPTPGAASASGSAHTDPDKDPFLSLLEQLAENEVSRGGPSELGFFLSGTG